MSFQWGSRSRERLVGVHPDLVRVLNRALERSRVDMAVIEGVRTLARQRKYMAEGRSQTLNSRHLVGRCSGVCYAADVVPWVGGRAWWSWQGGYYERVAQSIKAASAELGIEVEWGGDWRWRDGPHWQLPHRTHPKR